MGKEPHLFEQEFIEKVNECLLPSSPIKNVELLRGRSSQLSQIKRALTSPGRNAFIYGDRGVGKTSVAQTASLIHQSSDNDPVLLSCDQTLTCFKVAQTIATRFLGEDPRKIKSTQKRSVGASFHKLSAKLQHEIEKGTVPLPVSIDDAVGIIRFTAPYHSNKPVVVIDEFERIENEKERALFGDFIKQIGDQEVNVKLIFSGVGTSLNDLLSGHQSCFRYLESIHLERLEYTPRLEIISHAASYLKIDVPKDFAIRIAMISDGFPHYIHLICHRMFWSVFDSTPYTGEVSPVNFTAAIDESVNSVEPTMKTIYDKATQKYEHSDQYKHVLWALADHPDLLRKSSDIYDSYSNITLQFRIQAADKQIEETDKHTKKMDRNKFNSRLNALKTKAHGSILTGTRQGWYRFTLPVIRGYCRLQAEKNGLTLDRDNYLQLKRTTFARLPLASRKE